MTPAMKASTGSGICRIASSKLGNSVLLNIEEVPFLSITSKMVNAVEVML